MTVILVTHDREEALSMSDRIALLFDGQLSQIGTPRQVYDRPENRQVADYFGNCVYIPGSVSGGVFAASGISCAASVPDGAYSLMLRPDCLYTDIPGAYLLTVEEILFRCSDTLVSFRAFDGTLWKKTCCRDVTWKLGETVSATLQLSDPVLFKR